MAASASALRTEPPIPSAPGVSTSSAPSAFSRLRRSSLIVSGIVRISRYPRAAATKARAMPVLPLVGSIRTVSGPIRPCSSASLIIAYPMRSLTLPAGLKYSSFAITDAPSPFSSLYPFNSRRGVLPIRSVSLLAIFDISSSLQVQVNSSASVMASAQA
ncbi:hypothetical protein D3C71_1294490 [compost metagenome]